MSVQKFTPRYCCIGADRQPPWPLAPSPPRPQDPRTPSQRPSTPPHGNQASLGGAVGCLVAWMLQQRWQRQQHHILLAGRSRPGGTRASTPYFPSESSQPRGQRPSKFASRGRPCSHVRMGHQHVDLLAFLRCHCNWSCCTDYHPSCLPSVAMSVPPSRDLLPSQRSRLFCCLARRTQHTRTKLKELPSEDGRRETGLAGVGDGHAGAQTGNGLRITATIFV